MPPTLQICHFNQRNVLISFDQTALQKYIIAIYIVIKCVLGQPKFSILENKPRPTLWNINTARYVTFSRLLLTGQLSAC